MLKYILKIFYKTKLIEWKTNSTASIKKMVFLYGEHICKRKIMRLFIFGILLLVWQFNIKKQIWSQKSRREIRSVDLTQDNWKHKSGWDTKIIENKRGEKNKDCPLRDIQVNKKKDKGTAKIADNSKHRRKMRDYTVIKVKGRKHFKK